MITQADYAGGSTQWCPGCGNFGILNALRGALVALQIPPSQVLLVSGIGQAGKLPHHTRGNVFNSLHGRPISPAIGARIVNPRLKVIAVSGDGDAYAEGGNHFLHASRRNHDITYLVHDNQVYGLTKGQASPTSDEGFVTHTTPQGAPASFNPAAVAIAAGASFVSRGFAGDVEHLSGLIAAAIRHRGFALVDILQPCVTFNLRNTFGWFQERVYHLGEDGAYDPTDKLAAFERSQEWGDRIPIGVIYQVESQPFEDRLPAIQEGPLVDREPDPAQVQALLAEFR